MSDSPWDGVGGGFRRSAEEAAAAYEDAACRRILQLAGQASLVPALRAASRQATGEHTCRFHHLPDVLPALSVRFGHGNLRYVKRIAVPDLFDRFSKTPIWLGLTQVAEFWDVTETPIALVFRWKAETAVGAAGRERRAGIKGGKFMVAHTASTSDRRRTRIIRTMDLAGTTVEVTIETLDDLIAGLGVE